MAPNFFYVTPRLNVIIFYVTVSILRPAESDERRQWRRSASGGSGSDRRVVATTIFLFSFLLIFSSSLLILHRNTAVLLIIGLSCLWSLRFSESKLPQNEVEHERLVEAYSVVNQKLKHSLSEQTNLERTIQKLTADSRRCERDYSITQKEIVDLQKQVTIIIKECRDVQLR